MSQQVVVDTAQIENKEAYAPQITLEGSKVVVQVPSTWWVHQVIKELDVQLWNFFLMDISSNLWPLQLKIMIIQLILQAYCFVLNKKN